jgi:hypothetical protein
MEPHQDSCDGMAGTAGWSQVVVQSGFNWQGSLPALANAMDARLAELGWGSPSLTAYPENAQAQWTKTLPNGSSAVLEVEQSGPGWQLTAMAPPVGGAATGC